MPNENPIGLKSNLRLFSLRVMPEKVDNSETRRVNHEEEMDETAVRTSTVKY